MTDAILAWDNAAGEGDLYLAGADLAGDDGIRTAVLVSLFSDRRAEPEELPAGDTDRRGWWGDGLNPPGDRFGSALWLLARRKREAGLLGVAEQYAREALAWMIEDGVAETVTAAAEWGAHGELRLGVQIVLPDRTAREYQFHDVLRTA